MKKLRYYLIFLRDCPSSRVSNNQGVLDYENKALGFSYDLMIREIQSCDAF